MKKGLLIILSGPSWVGKGTVRKELMGDSSLDLFYSISMTTREKRPGELDGKDYYFVSDEEFDKNLNNGNLLEWASFVGHRYGTPADKVEEMRLSGKNVLLEIEVTGTMKVLEKLSSDDIVSIFLLPPSFAALENRIRGRRTESEQAIEERLMKAHREMSLEDHYQYKVYNEDVKQAAADIKRIILKRMGQR